MLVYPSAHRDSWYHQSTCLIHTKSTKEKKKRICIYSKTAPHQKSEMYVFMLFFMLCSKYVYMQTHVLLMSENKDDKVLRNGGE